MTEIAIQFKRAPFVLFREDRGRTPAAQRLVLHLQPDEGISLSFGAKIPGPVVQIGGVDMDFNYTDYFNATPQTGYERLLYDCMIGDATLFQRSDMVESAWHVVAPILDVWGALPPRGFPNYPAGTWGPTEADDMLPQGPASLEHFGMILAGDIGGTNTRLAFFEGPARSLPGSQSRYFRARRTAVWKKLCGSFAPSTASPSRPPASGSRARSATAAAKPRICRGWSMRPRWPRCWDCRRPSGQ